MNLIAHGNPSLPTFRVDGFLFRVTPAGDLQHFQTNFNANTGLGEMHGFWKSIKKVFKVAAPIAAVAYGANYATGGKMFSALPSLSKFIPSASTVAKAATIGVSLMTAKAGLTQAKLMQQQGQQIDPSQYQQQFAAPGTNQDIQQQQYPAGVTPTIDPKLLMIGGAGLLLVVLMMSQSRKR